MSHWMGEGASLIDPDDIPAWCSAEKRALDVILLKLWGESSFFRYWFAEFALKLN